MLESLKEGLRRFIWQEKKRVSVIGEGRTKVGFTNPTGDFPAAILCSLIKVNTEANIGVPIDVP